MHRVPDGAISAADVFIADDLVFQNEKEEQGDVLNAEAMNLNLDMDIQQTARNCAEQA
jgi:hypothetical protein